MDGVSGAASVAALLGIVLKIHSLISKLKNGSKFAQQTLENLDHLRSVLQRLENLPKGSFHTGLTHHLQASEADLKAFHEKIQKLNINGSRKRISWKSVQIKLKEEDIRQISDAIDDHYQKLSLELQVTEFSHSQARAANLQKLSTKMDSHSTAQQEATTVQQNILSSLKTLNDGMNSLQAAAVAWQQEKNSSASRLNDIFEDVRNQLQDFVSKNHTNESSETGNKPPESTAASDSATEMASSNTHTAHPDIGRKVQDAIDILRELMWDEGTCYEAQEAERLLGETQQLFELLRQSESEGCVERSVPKSTKRKITDNDSEEEVLFNRELKKLRGVFLSDTMNVNMKERNPRGLSQSKGGLGVRHVVRQTPSGIVKLQVRSSKDQENEQSSRHGSANFIRAMFEYLPYNKDDPWIGITLARQRMQENFLVINPSLLVSSIKQYGSLGFELIVRGNLEDFRRSLSRREICLNDRDPDGRSYLNYALFATQPEICRFLIEKGADVDFVEPDLGPDRIYTEDGELMKVSYDPCLSFSERGNFFPTAEVSEGPIDYCGSFTAHWSNLCEADTEFQRACNRCHRYLLEANADPSLTTSYAGNHIVKVLEVGTTDSIRQLLDLGLHYGSALAELNSRDWLQFHLSRGRWTFESVKLILSRQGTNGFPLQNLEACLHQTIQGSLYASTADLEEVLVMLVKAGADPWQRDPRYGTVSAVVGSAKSSYRRQHQDFREEVRGNHDFILKDLWSRALTRCGFDAGEVIETSGISDEEESETDSEASEDASEENNCETIYDESEEDSEEDNETDDILDEEPASSEGQMEVDPQKSNSFFLGGEDRMLLEQDAQVWME